MRRTCLAALCLSALLCGPAWSQGQGNAPALSPDGKLLAVARKVDGKEGTKAWSLDLVETDCVLRGKPAASCTRTVAEDLFLPPTFSNYFIQWARNSQKLIAGSRIISVTAGIEAIAKHRSLIEPRIFEPEFLSIDPPPRDNAIDPAEIDGVIVNGRGHRVGLLLNRFPDPRVVADLWGHEIDAPNLMASMETRSLASEPGFYLWASEASERGLLAEFKPGGLKTFDVPAEVHGPARMAWDSSTGAAAAFFDPFGIYPLPERSEELEWLEEYVDAMRVDDPSAELLAVSISTDTGVAYLQILKGLACTETLIVSRDIARSLSEQCATWSRNRPSPVLTSVTIPTAGFDLKGQLYAWPAAPNEKPRGLLIYFHGGPRRDVMSDRTDIPAHTLSDRFDILMVDYRGSTVIGPHRVVQV